VILPRMAPQITTQHSAIPKPNNDNRFGAWSENVPGSIGFEGSFCIGLGGCLGAAGIGGCSDKTFDRQDGYLIRG
jgi:hypothetical protein